jgi:tRNA pseudouridine38-40 synthase
LRYKACISYDGTDFYGWQEQVNFPTIQAEIQAALERISGERIGVTGAGRTDSGVHAIQQVAHFNWDHALPPDKLRLALNAIIPPTIRILEIQEVSGDFHARYDARSKSYIYRIDTQRIYNPFYYRYSLHYFNQLVIPLLINTAKVLEGEHDFVAFQATGTELTTSVRQIFQVEVLPELKDPSLNYSFLCIRFEATGFLRKMVRFMVGTLLEIGAGKRDPNDVARALQTGDRKYVGVPAPARGLFLEKVNY